MTADLDGSIVSALHDASAAGVGDAVAMLTDVVAELEARDHLDGGLEAVRTVLATHLVAINAVRDVRAAEDTAARLVRRAVDAALGVEGRGQRLTYLASSS